MRWMCVETHSIFPHRCPVDMYTTRCVNGDGPWLQAGMLSLQVCVIVAGRMPCLLARVQSFSLWQVCLGGMCQ